MKCFNKNYAGTVYSVEVTKSGYSLVSHNQLTVWKRMNFNTYKELIVYLANILGLDN